MNQQAPEKPVEFMILQNVPLQSLPSLENSEFTSAWRAMVKNAKKQHFFNKNNKKMLKKC